MNDEGEREGRKRSCYGEKAAIMDDLSNIDPALLAESGIHTTEARHEVIMSDERSSGSGISAEEEDEE